MDPPPRRELTLKGRELTQDYFIQPVDHMLVHTRVRDAGARLQPGLGAHATKERSNAAGERDGGCQGAGAGVPVG
jgi:hypothetical protein